MPAAWSAGTWAASGAAPSRTMTRANVPETGECFELFMADIPRALRLGSIHKRNIRQRAGEIVSGTSIYSATNLCRALGSSLGGERNIKSHERNAREAAEVVSGGWDLQLAPDGRTEKDGIAGACPVFRMRIKA